MPFAPCRPVSSSPLFEARLTKGFIQSSAVSAAGLREARLSCSPPHQVPARERCTDSGCCAATITASRAAQESGHAAWPRPRCSWCQALPPRPPGPTGGFSRTPAPSQVLLWRLRCSPGPSGPLPGSAARAVGLCSGLFCERRGFLLGFHSHDPKINVLLRGAHGWPCAALSPSSLTL